MFDFVDKFLEEEDFRHGVVRMPFHVRSHPVDFPAIAGANKSRFGVGNLGGFGGIENLWADLGNGDALALDPVG